MRKFLVTGATGFLGKNFVDKLLAAKEKIIVLVRDAEKAKSFWGNKVCIIQRNLENMADISREEIGISNADELIVVHFAWEGTGGSKRTNEEVQINNVLYSCRFLRKMYELGCKRFINAGSIMEYEAMKILTKDSEVPQRNMIYSVAKLSADFMQKLIAADIGVEYVNVIISNVYGCGEHSERFLNVLVRKMMKEEVIDLTEGTQLYDFIYIDDAVEMLYLVVKAGKAFEAYYIGNDKQQPLRTFVKRAYNVIGGNAQLKFGSIPFYGNLLNYTEFDCNKVMRELGYWPQVSFEEGISRMREAELKNE